MSNQLRMQIRIAPLKQDASITPLHSQLLWCRDLGTRHGYGTENADVRIIQLNGNIIQSSPIERLSKMDAILVAGQAQIGDSTLAN